MEKALSENLGKTEIFFFATSSRILYEIYVNGLISYEPSAKKVFHFTLGEADTVRIRGLLFTKRGVLKNSSELGYFQELRADTVYILAGERSASIVSRDKFLSATEKEA